MKKVPALIFFVVAASLAAPLAAQGAGIGLGTSPSGGQYLTDAKGMTLYYYTKDQGGTSECNGNCLKAWPAFYAGDGAMPAGLDAADFGTLTRADGSMQSTYKGWPLYYWVKDTKPGDMTGEGVGKVWYVLKVPAYTVMIATDKTLGNYLVDGLGRSLYWFTKDQPGAVAGMGGANPRWPAFAPDAFVVPSALNSADFGLITRGDGTRQATYKGYPLYYFVGDSMRGEVKGQDLGKAWYLIDPERFPPAM